MKIRKYRYMFLAGKHKKNNAPSGAFFFAKKKHGKKT